MRPMRINDLLKYRFPSPEEVYFLDGILFEPLTPDQMLQLASLPYRDDYFIRLAYSVSYRSLRHFIDEDFIELIKKIPHDSSNFTSSVTEIPIRCLTILTNLKSPLYQVREMKWIKGTYLLGCYGMYTIQWEFDYSEELLLMVATRIVQYSLESCNPYKRLFIGLIEPDNRWQLMLVNMNISPFLMQDGGSPVSALIRVYDPKIFVKMVSGELNPNDVPCQELRLITKVAVSLQHFK